MGGRSRRVLIESIEANDARDGWVVSLMGHFTDCAEKAYEIGSVLFNDSGDAWAILYCSYIPSSRDSDSNMIVHIARKDQYLGL